MSDGKDFVVFIESPEHGDRCYGVPMTYAEALETLQRNMLFAPALRYSIEPIPELAGDGTGVVL